MLAAIRYLKTDPFGRSLFLSTPKLEILLPAFDTEQAAVVALRFIA